MEIPVTGFVYHSDDQHGQHAHGLYITTWNGRPVHIHAIAGVTTVDVGHRHRYAGETAPAPSGVPHTHEYYTSTSFDDGHTHVIRGTTGPAIPFPQGGHYHLFQGMTTVNGTIPHSHAYSGRTGQEL